MRLFQDLVREELLRRPTKLKILDVGGDPIFWEMYGDNLDWSNISVTVANIMDQISNNPCVTCVIGDARNLEAFSDNSFDIVFSNSVVEHVGLFKEMQRMAKEVQRVAPRYFVQTPNFWFPFEPHFRVPIFHWLPELMRAKILMKYNCGNWPKAPDIGVAIQWAQHAFLLDRGQMQYLFPDAQIVSEKMFGLTKSFIAIR